MHKCVQRPVHQANAAIQTDMKLPILHPSPDRPLFLQTFFYSSFRRSCCVFNWLWRSTAGGPVCQWGKQWWSLCGRERSPPGTKHSRELTQAGYSATPHPHSLPRLLCPPVFSSDMFLSFCSPVCLFLSVFSPQRQLFSPGAGGRAENAMAAQIFCSWDCSAVCR